MTIFDEQLTTNPALTEAIHNRALGDGGNGQWWLITPRTDGTTRAYSRSPTTGRPYEAQRVFAMDMVQALARQLSFGGAWVIGFSHPEFGPIMTLDDWDFRRLWFFWLDADGDPQLTIACEDRFGEIVAAGPDKWMEDCETAYQSYREMMTWVDPRTEQQFMAAKGERRPAPPPDQRKV